MTHMRRAACDPKERTSDEMVEWFSGISSSSSRTWGHLRRMTKPGVIRACTNSDQVKLTGSADKSVTTFNLSEKANQKLARVRCVTLWILSAVSGEAMGNYCPEYMPPSDRKSLFGTNVLWGESPGDPRTLAGWGGGSVVLFAKIVKTASKLASGQYSSFNGHISHCLKSHKWFGVKMSRQARTAVSTIFGGDLISTLYPGFEPATTSLLDSHETMLLRQL